MSVPAPLHASLARRFRSFFQTYVESPPLPPLTPLQLLVALDSFRIEDPGNEQLFPPLTSLRRRLWRPWPRVPPGPIKRPPLTCSLRSFSQTPRKNALPACAGCLPRWGRRFFVSPRLSEGRTTTFFPPTPPTRTNMPFLPVPALVASLVKSSAGPRPLTSFLHPSFFPFRTPLKPRI